MPLLGTVVNDDERVLIYIFTAITTVCMVIDITRDSWRMGGHSVRSVNKAWNVVEIAKRDNSINIMAWPLDPRGIEENVHVLIVV